MRILITGASGFVGSHLGVRLARAHDVLGIAHTARRLPPFPCARADITDFHALRSQVRSFRPQAIVHAAALSRVLDCETRPDEAQRVNVDATAHLLHLAEQLHAKFVFLSSDQVFSGRKGGYRESDTPHPFNCYGTTKLQAEQLVLNAAARCLILRCNSVVGQSFGWGESFTDMVRNRLQRNEVVELFSDQYRSPIHVRSLAEIVQAACEMEHSGLLHVGGLQRMSRLDIGYAAARTAGLNPDLIHPTSYTSHPHARILTRDTSYDISRLRQMMPFVELKRVDEELLKDAETFQDSV